MEKRRPRVKALTPVPAFMFIIHGLVLLSTKTCHMN